MNDFFLLHNSNIYESLILLLLAFVVIIIAIAKNMFVITIFMSIFSILMAIIYSFMHAPDVAMTEAAVNASLSTIFVLIAMFCVYNKQILDARSNDKHSVVAFLICTLLFAFLSFFALQMPGYGEIANPINNHVTPYYIQNTGKEIGIESIVAAILASYRGYDTLGETTVVLLAGICVYMLLQKKTMVTNKAKTDHLLATMSKIIIPIISVFAIYIQINGEKSPGGGFQAGAILAAAFVFYGSIFGSRKLKVIFSLAKLNMLMALGVLIYAITGVVSIFLGGEYLNYSVLSYDPMTGQKIGIFIIELGVGITVASVMIAIYLLLMQDVEEPNDI
jgi:multicomponent Na+:H+ antiporter subunit B